MSAKPLIWKHDCIKHGMVTAAGEGPCDPPCDDPWQVDMPRPQTGASFATQPEALAWVSRQLKGTK